MMKIPPKIKNIFIFTLMICIVLPVIAFAEEAEEERTCPTFADLMDVKNVAFLTGVYNVIKQVCSAAANTSWGAFAGSLQGVVAVGIAIYIALATLKNVGAFSQQDVAAYLTADKKGVIPLVIKAASIIFLLSNRGFVYEYLVSPIVQAGSEIGGSGYGSGFSGDVSGLFSQVITKSNQFLVRAYKIVALGRMLLCLAFLPESIVDWYWSMIPFGAVLFIFGWMIIIGVSFYLLDVMFRLGVGCILLPMGIACGVSRLTSHYTKQVWNLFINVAFNFVMLGIIINFTLSMIGVSLSGIDGGTNITELLTNIGGKAPAKAETDEIRDALTLTGFVLLAISCMIAFKLFMSVEQVASKVAQAASVGKAGQKAGAEIMQKAGNIAKAPVQQAGKLAGFVGQEIKNDINDSEAMRGARRAWRGTKSAVKTFFRVKD